MTRTVTGICGTCCPKRGQSVFAGLELTRISAPFVPTTPPPNANQHFRMTEHVETPKQAIGVSRWRKDDRHGGAATLGLSHFERFVHQVGSSTCHVRVTKPVAFPPTCQRLPKERHAAACHQLPNGSSFLGYLSSNRVKRESAHIPVPDRTPAFSLFKREKERGRVPDSHYRKEANSPSLSLHPVTDIPPKFLEPLGSKPVTDHFLHAHCPMPHAHFQMPISTQRQKAERSLLGAESAPSSAPPRAAPAHHAARLHRRKPTTTKG